MSRSDKELVGQIRSKARTWTGVVCGITGVGNYMVVCTFGTIVAVGGGTYKNGESVVVTRFDTGEYSIIGGASSAMESSVSAIPGSGAVLEGPGIDLNGSYVGIGLDSILLQSVSGTFPAREYFTIWQALADAASGDVVLLNPKTFAESVTVPPGVTLMGISSGAAITGMVTLGNGAVVKNLAITRSSDDGDDLIGVLASSGTSYLMDSTVTVSNGTGSAYSVKIVSGAILHATHVNLISSGYCAYVEDGELHHLYGRAVSGESYPYYVHEE